MYSLIRERDGAGDSGTMSLALWVDDDGKLQSKGDARPRVGVMMRVGSLYARTMQLQDWWQTTYITEILEDVPKMVRFVTENGSTYTWTKR